MWSTWEVLVTEFASDVDRRKSAAVMRQLHRLNVIRLIDLLVVSKSADGTVLAEASTALPLAEARRERELAEWALGLGRKQSRRDAGTPAAVAWHGRSAVLDLLDVGFLARQVGPGKAVQAALLTVQPGGWLRPSPQLSGRRLLMDVELPRPVAADGR